MANYKCEQEDILFNLIDVLSTDKLEEYGLDRASIQEIIIEYDKFIENEIYPTRIKSDSEGLKLTSDGVKVPEFLQAPTRAYYDMGWFALGVPEEVGGTPVPEALAVCCRALNMAANCGWSMYPGLTKGAFNVMRLIGDEYIKNTYLAPMLEGKWGGTMCLTEAGAGSDVGNLKTTATPIDGKDGWFKIQGTKIFISSGESDLYDNNIHLVLARTPGAPEGVKGISLFVVPRYKVNDDGSLNGSNDVICSGIEHKMGINISATSVLNFGENGGCEGYLIGKEFDGMSNMFIMMNEARLDCGMQGEAQGNLAYMLTKQYVAERVQFGTEIINHPDIKKMMLKMRCMGRGLRALNLYAANLFDMTKIDKKFQSYIEFLTPVCKSFGSEQGFNIAVEAVQAHGGYGYCSEYGIEQFVRDIKISTIYEGTNGIQAIDFVTRKILKDELKTFNAITKDIRGSIGKLNSSYKNEKMLFTNAVDLSEKAIKFIATKAKSKEDNIVLQSCKDFLDLYGYIATAWRLMESAVVAEEKLKSSSSPDEKIFLETKIIDFKVFCSQYLVHTLSLGESIIECDLDYSKLEL